MKEYLVQTLHNIRFYLTEEYTTGWLLDNPDGEHWIDLLDKIELGLELGYTSLRLTRLHYNCGRLEGAAAAMDMTVLELLSTWDVELEDA